METPKAPYTLYHNYWSSCSLFVRLTLELGAQPPNIFKIPIVEKEIDINHGGQLEESFICKINRLGTVPVFTHPTLLSAPMTESLEITRLIYQRYYPHLCPSEHQVQIEELLDEIHSISFPSLSFRKWPQKGEQAVNGLKSKLEEPGLSQRHRDVLEDKLSRAVRMWEKVLTTERKGEEDVKTRALFEKLAGVKRKYGGSGSDWLFGTDYGTALDAHTLILLARINDVELEELVHPDMLAYGKVVMEGEVWRNFMQGRTTLHIPGS